MSKLPRFAQPRIVVDFPCYAKKKVSFRPFTVREEGILLMAKASQETSPGEVPLAIMDVLDNCALDEGFKSRHLTTFELDMAFVRLRGASVSNVMKATYVDNEDKKPRDFFIECDKAKVTGKVEDKKKVVVGDVGVEYGYPLASCYDDPVMLDPSARDHDVARAVITGCITSVWKGDEVVSSSEVSPEEMAEFVLDMPPQVYREIAEHVEKGPRLEYVFEYENDLKHKRSVRLRTLQDFFHFA